MTAQNSSRTSLGWLPKDLSIIEAWIEALRAAAKKNKRPLIEPIKEFRQMVYSTPSMYASFQGMFAEAHRLKKRTPLAWESEPINFEEFLVLLNEIMNTAPKAYQSGRGADQEPAGMIGFPINALLAWPMATDYGYNVFSNSLVNQQLKKILQYWSSYLVSEDSRYVLVEGDPAQNVIPWLSEKAQTEMINVAAGALGYEGNPVTTDTPFDQIFKCNPDADKYYGFKSWDDFFTREFVKEARPVTEPENDDVIVNACESAPLGVRHDVALTSKFWLKGQEYSLENMMNFDELAPQFEGGTVYQAFLSALSYHRWHSPVRGKIVKAYVVNGSYYLENSSQGFYNSDHEPDPSAPNNSQQFLTAVATRALIFIEPDNKDIGLMCVMPVGMAEVSSCEITVKEGDKVEKGQELGMFHFGGSTHCLIFGPQAKLNFEYYENMGLDAENNICINTKIAEVRR
ncbi:MAG: phosphatidylserine decarboxylase family protein [Flavobacteriales bacterium]|nr:phosphatidylserine decarboxylase family protein [Flavobacteriales bacterium]